MELVVLETPYAGDIERNIEYAQKCMRDCLMKGEAPFASHLLYTQPNVLDDSIPEERALGINSGLLWGDKSTKTIVYTDYGISIGMRQGIARAVKRGSIIEYRELKN